MSKCNVPGCDRRVHIAELGLCKTHYRRLKKCGDVQAGIPVVCHRESKQVELKCEVCGVTFYREPNYVRRYPAKYCSPKCTHQSRRWTPEDFWKMVTKTDGCWIWNGCKQPTGHGCVASTSSRGLGTTAHRVAWVLTYGPVPEGKEICHRCPGGSNPSCVRPDHLYAGTRKENMADAIREGTVRRGEKHHCSKFKDADILEIRSLRAKGMSIRKLGKLFGVRHSYISNICRRKVWKHI